MSGGTEVQTKNEIKDRDKNYMRVEEKKKRKRRRKRGCW